MPYGRDAISREPREPLFVDADSEEAARKQAVELGIAVEEVEAVQPRQVPSSSTSQPEQSPRLPVKI